mmetsp:Transcript_1634/g.2520  ORF Transcript_1634/g.2520 Transcript_1634/m.2520 type:complete len:80 (-) Transcript_1634:1171-1410(-)
MIVNSLLHVIIALTVVKEPRIARPLLVCSCVRAKLRDAHFAFEQHLAGELQIMHGSSGHDAILVCNCLLLTGPWVSFLP